MHSMCVPCDWLLPHHGLSTAWCSLAPNLNRYPSLCCTAVYGLEHSVYDCFMRTWFLSLCLQGASVWNQVVGLQSHVWCEHEHDYECQHEPQHQGWEDFRWRFERHADYTAADAWKGLHSIIFFILSPTFLLLSSCCSFPPWFLSCHLFCYLPCWFLMFVLLFSHSLQEVGSIIGKVWVCHF